MLELTSRKFPVVTGKRILNLFEMRVQAKYESYRVNPQYKHSFATLPVSKAWKLAQSERESVNCTGEENFNDFSFTRSRTKKYLLNMHDWSAPPKTFNIFSSRITLHQILQVAFTEADICWLPTLSVVPSMLVANKAYVRRMRGNGAC